jgi:tetratricopeptide (TPR) repeat protein
MSPDLDSITGPPAPAAGDRPAPADAAETEYRVGLALHEEGRAVEAAQFYQRALRCSPQDERFHFSLGKAFQDAGRFQDALSCYRRTIALDADCVPAYFNMGLLFIAQALYPEALAALQQAVVLAPGFAGAHNNLGIAFQALKRDAEALACFQRAVQANPDYSEAWCNVGRLLFAQQRWDEALPVFQKAFALKPAWVEPLHNLGLCHHKKRELELAEACYRQVLALKPDHLPAHLDLGNIFLDRGDLPGMAAWYRKALELTPDNTEACVNVGRMLRDQGRWEEALACYDQTLQRDPGHVESHFSRALICLALGRFSEGWKAYEWRFQMADWSKKSYPHQLRTPRWNGDPFVGRTLLVHHEQGFGDTLQFVRYLPLVKARGGTVLLEVPAALRSLLHAIPGADDVVELSPAGPTERGFDLHVPLLSLPGIFGTTLESISAKVPYLSADPAKTAAWAKRLGGHFFKIGIAWSSSAWNAKLAEKSCPISHFLPLAQTPGARLVGLQKKPAPNDLAAAAAEGIRNYGEEFADFSDTAAAIANLDLVIAVDTAVAHLAGAMGKPVWVPLLCVADWRWLLNREDSPWYPTMRLYRQPRPGAWDDLFRRLAQDLKTAVALQREHPR